MTPFYHVLYVITNTITNEYYIGSHTTKDLNDNYFGSGTQLKKNIELYGKSNFIKKIIWYADNRKQLSELELKLTIKHIGNPLCLNKKLGGRLSNIVTPNLLQERIDSGTAKYMRELYEMEELLF